MNFKLIRVFFFCIFGFLSVHSFAQTKDDYLAEIGINGGGCYYLGEANNQLFSNMRIAYSGFIRYRLNQRIAFKAELGGATVAGSGIKDRQLFVGDLTGEYNFFDLEQNPYKRFSKTFSPYIFAGIGGLTGVYNGQSLPIITLPFGVGMKVKLNERLNLNFQWTTRIAFADNLEGTTKPKVSDQYNNPNNLNGSNIFNNDLLSTFTVGLSLDFWKKPCDCKNIK